MGEKSTGYSVGELPEGGESMSHVLDFLFRFGLDCGLLAVHQVAEAQRHELAFFCLA